MVGRKRWREGIFMVVDVDMATLGVKISSFSLFYTTYLHTHFLITVYKYIKVVILIFFLQLQN